MAGAGRLDTGWGAVKVSSAGVPDLAWTVTLIGGFVVVALLLRLTGGRPGTHDGERVPAHRRVLPPR